MTAEPLPAPTPGTSTARPTPSPYMRLVTRVLSTEPKLMADREAFRRAHEGRVYPEPAPAPPSLRAVANVSRWQVDRRDVYTVTPLQAGRLPAATKPWRILYLHGGGFVNALISVHWEIVHSLIAATGATVTVPTYPLAPENDHRAGNAHIEAVYRELLRRVDSERIVVTGDSAGGGMALVLAMRLRDAGLPLPARLVLFSPCTCVVPDNPEADAIEPLDVILARPGGSLAGLWWAGPDPPTHPEVSPLFGDLHGLPPVDIYQGTADILWPDVRLTAAKIAAAGGQARLVEYPGAIHVFVGATFTPEARDAMRRVADSLDAHPAPLPRATRLASSPELVLTRQAFIRLHARSTPWIRHVGARANLRGRLDMLRTRHGVTADAT